MQVALYADTCKNDMAHSGVRGPLQHCADLGSGGGWHVPRLVNCLQAVEASEFVVKGNVNLEKAIRLNSSTRKLMFCFFFVASLLLLLFDWWYS